MKPIIFGIMAAMDLTETNSTNKRVVLQNGSILNRYWDLLNTPRPETYRVDIEIAE